MVQKTLLFILGAQPFKILGAGRTDAKVSALDYAFELQLNGKLPMETTNFLKALDHNLPPDIRAMGMATVVENFNIIQSSKVKEYRYLFSFGQKNHPYAAPFITGILEPLDIEAMREAAPIFIGRHDFSAFSANVKEGTRTVRDISHCSIVENTMLTANFFPEKSYALQIAAEGFMRYQVRMIMGALIQLGKGERQQAELEALLRGEKVQKLNYVAPGSGLHLHHVKFGESS